MVWQLAGAAAAAALAGRVRHWRKPFCAASAIDRAGLASLQSGQAGTGVRLPARPTPFLRSLIDLIGCYFAAVISALRHSRLAPTE